MPQKQPDSSIVWTDDVTYWAAVDETVTAPVSSGGAITTATIMIEARQTIRLRNKVVLDAQDRLKDYASGNIYLIDSMVWSFPTNETILATRRKEWGATS